MLTTLQRFWSFSSISILSVVVGLAATSQHAFAQGFGMGGGGNFGSGAEQEFTGDWYGGTKLSTGDALSVITVEATAEQRVTPEEIRVVLAVTNEAETAADCQTNSEQQVNRVLAAWKELQIPDDKIVTDFISLLPRYEWRLMQRDGNDVRIQQRQGYRIQTNLHVSVPDEPAAMKAVNAAFQADVTDIVTFDYWSSQLDQQLEQAQQLAIAAAKKKSDRMLAVFDRRPPLINISESSAVYFPRSLYRTYQNVLEEEVDEYSRAWRDTPAIKAFRPKMTFFDGLKSASDIRPTKADMRPEIAVVATVRLYFESPATKTPPAMIRGR